MTADDTATSRPLIPRQSIFGNPERIAAQVSPDGRHLSFLAPRDGVLNIWVLARGEPLANARPLTHEKVRPLMQHFWSESGEEVLYLQDKGGDEDFLLYAVNVASGVERCLTAFQGVRVEPLGGSVRRPDEIAIAINDRDPSFHDPFLLNVRTGALRRLFENTQQFAGFIVDDDLAVRFVTRATPDGGFEVLRRVDDRTEPFDQVGFEDSQTTHPGSLTTDGRILHWTESRARDTAALLAIDLATGTRTVVAEDPRADIGATLADPLTGRVLAYSVDYLTRDWRAVDPSVAEDLAFLDRALPGEWAVQSQTRDNRIWLVGHDPVTAPSRVLVYDRGDRSLVELYVGRPALVGAPLPEVHPVQITARDGLVMVGYLTLPVGAAGPGGGARPARPLPMVLDVHGGPWARDGYGYDPQRAWFADRGYACLQVNFRGSTGFGKSFINRGDLEWGRGMHDDLLDAVAWAVAQGIARPDRVAIYGGSYGGYASLWAATRSPDVFACAVAIVAPSNLNTLLGSMPPYWESFREQMYRRVGDPRTEAGRALLAERSPLTHADRIRRPLLIGQGANDPRVKQAEAEQIVGALRAHGIPVTYVLYPDEGHGFARSPNRTSFYAVAEAFLARCLGGRFEPVGDDFAGASIQVPVGADEVPGLPDALRSRD